MTETIDLQQKESSNGESYWCAAAPNIQRVWSASSLSTFSDCPRKYELSYVEGWTPKGEALDLMFGTCWHTLMEVYWHLRLDKNPHDDVLREIIPDALGMTLPPASRPKQAGKTAASLARSLVWYFEQYQHDEIDSIVVLPSGKPAIELHFTFMLNLINPDGEPYQIQGYLDQLRTFNSVYTVWDYKTTTNVNAPFYAQRFEIDLQSQIYTLAAHALTNEKYSMFMVDAMGVGVTYSEFNRIPVPMTDGELNEAILDIHALIREAERCAEANYYPKNTGSCGFCQFNGICNKDPQSRLAFLNTDFDEKRREKVEPRKRIS
jgi:hypothetical protein